MPAPPTNHPDHAQLAAFAHGRLREPDATTVESHLDVCEACGSFVDQLQPDPFVSALRCAARLDTPSGCPVDAPTAVFFGDATIPDAEPIPAELVAHPRYRLGALLGRGGMGAVYKAEHTLMERPVAVKVIAPRLLEHPGAVERFKQEVKAAAKLHHPNIVTAHDAEQVGPVTVLVMEFVEGRSLADVLAERGPLPIAEACEYARQAALGLAHAHGLGMVHRDIKPHNLMLAADGCVKILDFGLARFLSEGVADGAPETVPEPGAPTTAGLTSTGACMGTLDYMAPEQARDAGTADARADVYALGCTLYHLLTGQVPFPGGSGLEKLTRVMSDEPAPLAELRPDATPELASVVARLMAKRPEDRVASAAEAGELLAPFTREAEPPRRSRRRWWSALAAAALVAGVIIANAVIKVPTEQGELQIETDDPDIEVVIKGDRVVRIRDPKTGREYAIDRQNLTLGELDGDGLQVTLDGSKPVVLKRNGQKIASVRVVPKPTEASSEPPLTPGQLIRDIRWPGGAQSVYSTGISPDGRYFLATGDTAVRSCRVWEVATGNEVANLPGCEHGVFLSDSRHLLTATPERQLALWDVTTGREVKRFAAHADWINSVGVSADGSLALASDNSGTVRMYEVATGKELFGRRVSQGHCFAAISPDGKRIATESRVGRSIQVWDAETGKELRSWSVTPSDVHKLWFLTDGRSFLDLRADGTLMRWHEAEASPTPVLKLGPGVVSAGLSADGRILAVGFAHESAVRTYDLTNGRELGRVVVPTAGYATLAVSPDGRLGAAAAPTGVTGGHARVYVLQLPSRAGPSGGTELEGTWAKVSGADVGVAVPSGADPDTLVISGYRWQYVKGGLVIQTGTFTLDASKEPKEFTFTVTAGGNVGGVGYAIYTRDGDTFVFCTRDGDPALRPTDFTLKPGDGRYLQTWTRAPARTTPGTQTGRAVTLPPVELSVARIMTGQKDVRAVTASPDGKWLYSCGYDNTLRRWEAASGREVGRVGDAADPFDYLDLSANGSKLLVAHRDNTVRLWDTTTGETLKTFKGHTDLVCGVALSANGKRAISCGHDLTVRLWDVEEGKELKVLTGHKAMVRQVAFLPGDRAVSCAHDRTVRLWDLKEGKQLKQYGPFESWLCALAVLPGGTRVAVGTGISPIILELETGNVVRRFTGHNQAVHAAAVSPDGKLLATGGFDKTVRVWEIDTGRCVAIGRGHTEYVVSVAFAGNHTLLSAGDNTVRVWELPRPVAPMPRPVVAKPIPAELDLIPRNAAGFVTVPVNELMTTPALAWARQQVFAGGELAEYVKATTRLDLHEVTRATVVWPTAEHLGGNILAVPPEVPSRVLVLTSSKSIRDRYAEYFKLAIRAQKGTEEYRGRKYLLDADGWTAIFLANDHTLVVGSRAAVRLVIDRLSAPNPGPLDGAVRAATDRPESVVLGFQGAKGAGRAFAAQLPQVFGSLAPALAADRVTVVASCRDGMRLDYRGEFASEDGAKQVEVSLGEACAGGASALGELLAEYDRGMFVDGRDAERKRERDFFVQTRDALKAAKPERTATTVRLALRTESTYGFAMILPAVPYVLMPFGPMAMEPDEREATARDQAVARALMAYHAKHGHFPPPAVLDKDGKPLLSWRVAILPHLGDEAAALHKEFKLDEPWDSPANKKLLDRMPVALSTSPFKSRYRPRPNSGYRVYTAKGSVFEGPGGRSKADITDDLANTILAVRHRDEVPWTMPDVLTFDNLEIVPSSAVFAGGTVRSLCCDESPDTLKALITRNGGEKITPKEPRKRPGPGR